MASYQLSLPLMCNGSQINDFDKLYLAELLLIVLSYFCFHDTREKFSSAWKLYNSLFLS